VRPRRVALAISLALASGAGLAGCGPGNSLTGSIGEGYSLDFDRVQIRLQDETLLIEYLQWLPQGGANKVAKVVVEGWRLRSAPAAPLPWGPGFSLGDDAFLEVVTVERIALSGGPFPPVEAGSFTFASLQAAADGSASGSFNVLFANGRSLGGAFEGSIDEVDTR